MNIETGTLQNLKQTDKQSPNSPSYPKTDKDFKAEMADLKSEKQISDDSQINSGNTVADKYTVDMEMTAGCDTDGINDTNELLVAINEINSSINQTDDFIDNQLNQPQNKPDNLIRPEENKEPNNQLLNNDMNLTNIKNDKMQELKSDISFTQNGGEPFSSFFNNNNFQESNEELQEDSSVLSTMAENIAMVNRALAEKSKTTSDATSDIEKVGDVVDKTINATALNMSRSDVQFFINLTTGADFNLNEITETQNTSKSGVVSETLANLLAESMKNNKPFRINFDNDISVIIKLSKEGRISANFIPGSDAAENYLRNNISGLVQRFEDENLPYDELTHQRQKRDNEQEQNKKDKNNE